MFDQISKFKHDQTAPNKVAKQHNVHFQTMFDGRFGRQTFPVWTGRKAFRKGLKKYSQQKAVLVVSLIMRPFLKPSMLN